MSFRGIEKGSVVVISTIGSKRDRNFFMRGYNEMIRHIEPSLIIVYSDILPKMKGRFINFHYEDSFQRKNKLLIQGKLFDIPLIFEVKA